MRRAAHALLLACLAGSCAPPARLWQLRSATFRAARERRPQSTPAGYVERALHERGFRLSTDGSVASLYQALNHRYQAVAPDRARPGDVVFFDLDGHGCASHTGLVDGVEAGGRITFHEQRDGELRRSYAAPADPRTRRDGQ